MQLGTIRAAASGYGSSASRSLHHWTIKTHLFLSLFNPFHFFLCSEMFHLGSLFSKFYAFIFNALFWSVLCSVRAVKLLPCRHWAGECVLFSPLVPCRLKLKKMTRMVAQHFLMIPWLSAIPQETFSPPLTCRGHTGRLSSLSLHHFSPTCTGSTGGR